MTKNTDAVINFCEYVCWLGKDYRGYPQGNSGVGVHIEAGQQDSLKTSHLIKGSDRQTQMKWFNMW